MKVALLIAVAAFCGRVVATLAGVNLVAITVLTPFQLDALALGGFFAVWLRQPGARSAVRRAMSADCCWRRLVVVLLQFGLHHVTESGVDLMRPLRSGAFRVLFAVLLCRRSSLPPQSLVSRFFRSRAMVILGKYSYGLYVYHHFFSYYCMSHGTEFALARAVGSHTLAVAIQAVVGMAASMVDCLGELRVVREVLPAAQALLVSLGGTTGGRSMSDTGGRPRVLLIALQCNPDWVSAPLVGWSHSQALAAVADVHLVTHAYNRENLVKAGLTEGVDFTALNPGGADAFVHRISVLLGVPFGSQKGWTILTALSLLSYHYFETLTWRRFGARVRAREFDIVHRLTPLSPAVPSPIARRCARAGVPFVLGPINGGLPWPAGFGHVRAREKEWLSYVRGVHRWLPGFWSTRSEAAALIAGSRQALEEIPRRYRGKAVYVPENAIDLERFDPRVGQRIELPLRVGFVGRLVATKGVDMLLEAAAPLARAGKVRVDIIGDGPELPALKALAHRESMGDAVEFAGWVEHRELTARLQKCQVFGFPSVREFGGGVVLEAMALGLVPIVLDYGGPGELVSPATGFALPMGARGEVVQRIRLALERLVAEPSVLGPMGDRARQRVMRSFTWPVKASQVVEVYLWVLGLRDKPDFGMPLPDAASSVAAG